MRNTIELSIKSPCSENYKEFNKTEKGGFCKSCTKEVIDFRKLSDTQVLDYFKNNQQKTCGYFNKHQLKSYAEPKKTAPAKKYYFASASAIVLSVFSFLSNQTIIAQETNPKTTIQTIQNTPKKIINKENNMITLKGVVYGESDNTPLPGVSVVLKNSIVGTDTDFDGNFKLTNISEGDVLSFYSLGYISQDIIIKKNQTSLKVIMQEDSMLLGDIVVVGAVDTKSTYKTKRSIWQRVKSIF